MWSRAIGLGTTSNVRRWIPALLMIWGLRVFLFLDFLFVPREFDQGRRTMNADREEQPEQEPEQTQVLSEYGFGSEFRSLSICTTCLGLFDPPSREQGIFGQQRCACYRDNSEPRWRDPKGVRVDLMGPPTTITSRTISTNEPGSVTAADDISFGVAAAGLHGSAASARIASSRSTRSLALPSSPSDATADESLRPALRGTRCRG